MFKFVQGNRRLIQVFLGIITLPFAFVGVDSMVRQGGAKDAVVQVGPVEIGAAALDTAQREQQDRLRETLGERADPALFTTPEFRSAVLESLINRQLMLNLEGDARLMTPNEQVAKMIVDSQVFQEDGAFSKKRYDTWLAGQGKTAAAFEAQFRQDLTNRQLLAAISEASLPGKTAASTYARALLMQREAESLTIPAASYMSQVSVSEEEIKQWYESHRKDYAVPEQVRVQYVQLDEASLAQQMHPDEAAIKAYYEAHAGQFGQPEERRARHILIEIPAQQDKGAEAKAQEIAQALLKDIKRTPADFAKLAMTKSQDTGTAAQGGDLGWFRRGAMLPTFDAAAFSLPENAISDLIRTKHGFHIIQVTGIRPAQTRPLASVRAQVEDALRHEMASKKFNELAVIFPDLVYDFADSLQPVAEKLQLPVQTSGWLSRDGKNQPPPFDNAKLREAIFSDDTLLQKHNTKAIDVRSGLMVSARILEHQNASQKPLEAVRETLRNQLLAQAAAKAAERAGLAQLKSLQQGEKAKTVWQPAQRFSRINPQGLDENALIALFQPDKFPAYVGAATPLGYTLFRVLREVPPPPEAQAAEKALAARYENAVAQAEMQAWFVSLRQRYPVKMLRSSASTSSEGNSSK